MARRKFTIKANSGMGFFRPSSGEVTYTLSKALMTSPAFGTLPFSARLVLLDWIQFYYRKSAWESQDLTSVGIEYSYQVCETVGLSESAFLRARKLICDCGFFSAPEELQSSRPCSPKRFRPSDDWRTYQRSTKEVGVIEKWEVARAKRIERGESNRAKVMKHLVNEHRGKQKQAVKKADKSTVKKADIQKRADILLSVKKADT